jgi:hypothetical protein
VVTSGQNHDQVRTHAATRAQTSAAKSRSVGLAQLFVVRQLPHMPM